MPEVPQNTSNVPQTIYKPSEIIGIFNTYLSKPPVNAQLVYLRGIYLASGRACYNGYYYDTLRDEDRQEELTLYITARQRENLKNGNLVCVGGVIGRNVNTRGQIQLVLHTSRLEIVQEQAIDEAEIKRMELRKRKSEKGFSNVDGILEQLLYSDERKPEIALVMAESSITMSDFNAGINAAKSAIDFDEHRVNFANTNALTSKLRSLDLESYDAIAIVRGGGAGIEKLDELEVLQTVVDINTPIIVAVGHVDEKLFIKQICDKCISTPNGLGQYFSEMVENVSEKKSKSRAALTEQIKRQFQKQLDAGQKQNDELQTKLATLTDNQEKANREHAEQVAEAQRQNDKLQDQLRSLREEYSSQAKGTNNSLARLQENNSELQKSIQRLTTQNSEAQNRLVQALERNKNLEKQLAEQGNGNSKIWMIVAIIAVIVMIIVLITK